VLSCPRCGRENEPEARFCVGCGENLAQLHEKRERKDTYLGQVLDNKFMILEHLGDGGMGKVYKAEQLTLNKVVAVKILHRNMLQNETQVKRFQREAWSASRLDHPNSIGIIDVGKTEDDCHFIVMEYLEGEELSTLISEDKPIQEKRIVNIMSQVLSVLHEAHKNKIIHRDLKPENIMLIKRAEQDDYVKVLDFGIAKLQERDPNMPALTMQGIVCGTPEYMSPEQAMGKELDFRTDIYAAGCILYELLVGNVPFNANNYQAILGMHIREQPKRPSEVKPERNISVKLEEVALIAMQKDRTLRFPDAQAMRLALEESITDEMEQAESTNNANGGKTRVFGLGTEDELSGMLDEIPDGNSEMPPPSPIATNTMEVSALDDNPNDANGNTPIDRNGQEEISYANNGSEDWPVSESGKGDFFKIIMGIVAILIVVIGLLWYLYDGEDEPTVEEKKDRAASVVQVVKEEKAVEVKQDPTAKIKETSDVEQKEVDRTKEVPKPVKKKTPQLSALKKQQLALEYYEKGTAALTKGKLDSAIANFNTAKKYNPKSPSVYKKLGMAYMQKNSNKKAKANFERYLKLAPTAKDKHRIRELIDAL